MEIGLLYRNLYFNPTNSSVYKKIYHYYKSNNLIVEANAFAELIRYKFNEIVEDEPESLPNSEEPSL